MVSVIIQNRSSSNPLDHTLFLFKMIITCHHSFLKLYYAHVERLFTKEQLVHRYPFYPLMSCHCYLSV